MSDRTQRYGEPARDRDRGDEGRARGTGRAWMDDHDQGFGRDRGADRDRQSDRDRVPARGRDGGRAGEPGRGREPLRETSRETTRDRDRDFGRGGEAVRERRALVEESPARPASPPRSASGSSGRSGSSKPSSTKAGSDNRAGSAVLSVIIACVAGLILGLAGRAVHPYQAPAASGKPLGTGASSSAPAGSGPAAAPTTAAPVAPTLTVPATYTVPGSLSLSWPGSGESAVAVEGVGTMATHGSVNSPVPIASVTKTMTAYLILKDHPMAPGQSGATLTVLDSEAAAYAGERALNQSLVPVKTGEAMTELQALQALMLASADNVAQILGRWDAGSDTAFVAEMNSTAASLGMADTHFTDPSGYDSGTRSSADDLIKLAEAAMAVPAFAQIVGEQTAQVPLAGTVVNYNKLLGQDGVVGIKTGSTAAAGGCLLFAAHSEVDGQSATVIGVVLGAPGADATAVLQNVISDSQRLLVSAQHELTVATLAKPGVQVATGAAAPATIAAGAAATGSSNSAKLGPAQMVSLIAWPGLTLTLKVALVSGGPVLNVTMPDGSAVATTQLAAI